MFSLQNENRCYGYRVIALNYFENLGGHLKNSYEYIEGICVFLRFGHCVSSTTFQKGDIGKPHQPPTEKLQKFNVIFMIVKNIDFKTSK
jgi:hypothetical protein